MELCCIILTEEIMKMETKEMLRSQPIIQTLSAADEETIRLLAEKVMPSFRR